MQGIHGILGSGAGGGSGGPIFGDRRLRAAPPGQQLQQAIKCPRCDSSNTKFCYYNNYNLSQPRHFCKNCRRYWTNGGVLRNVPVGGGCRKAKRSSKRKAASPAPLHRPPPPTAANDRHNKSNSLSSSESTSANTAANARSAGGVADGVGSSGKGAVVTESCSESFSSPLFKFTEQLPATYTVQDPAKPDCSVANTNLKPLIDPGRVAQANSSGGAIFSEIGGFASFMSGDQSENLFGFGAGGDVAPTPFRIHHQNQVNHHHLMRNSTAEIWPMEKMDGGDHWGAAGVLDQTVQTDLLPSSRSTGGGVLAGSVWHGISGGERSNIGNLFDLTTASSSAHGGHWSQSADQWHESDHDHDQHLYLPP